MGDFSGPWHRKVNAVSKGGMHEMCTVAPLVVNAVDLFQGQHRDSATTVLIALPVFSPDEINNHSNELPWAQQVGEQIQSQLATHVSNNLGDVGCSRRARAGVAADDVVVIVPLLNGVHWTLIVYDVSKQTLFFINSFRSRGLPANYKRHIERLRDVLQRGGGIDQAARQAPIAIMSYICVQSYQSGVTRCGDWAAAFTYAFLAARSHVKGDLARIGDGRGQRSLLLEGFNYLQALSGPGAVPARTFAVKGYFNWKQQHLFQQALLERHCNLLHRWSEEELWNQSGYIRRRMQHLRGKLVSLQEQIGAGEGAVCPASSDFRRELADLTCEIHVILRALVMEPCGVNNDFPVTARRPGQNDYRFTFIEYLRDQWRNLQPTNPSADGDMRKFVNTLGVIGSYLQSGQNGSDVGERLDSLVRLCATINFTNFAAMEVFEHRYPWLMPGSTQRAPIPLQSSSDNRASVEAPSWWEALCWFPLIMLFTVQLEEFSSEDDASITTFLLNVFMLVFVGLPLLASWYEFLASAEPVGEADVSQEKLGYVSDLRLFSHWLRQKLPLKTWPSRLFSTVVGAVVMVCAYVTVPLWRPMRIIKQHFVQGAYAVGEGHKVCSARALGGATQQLKACFNDERIQERINAPRSGEKREPLTPFITQMQEHKQEMSDQINSLRERINRLLTDLSTEERSSDLQRLERHYARAQLDQTLDCLRQGPLRGTIHPDVIADHEEVPVGQGDSAVCRLRAASI